MIQRGKQNQPKNQTTSKTPQQMHLSGQITIIPKPELRGFYGDPITKPQSKVTSAEVAIICPDLFNFFSHAKLAIDLIHITD